MKVSARVIVTIEIKSGSTWEDSVPCDQVFKQAGEEAVNRLQRTVDTSSSHMKIIGKPQVTVVMGSNADD